MTEEEAKTKICHKTLAAVEAGSPQQMFYCLGSACMAWRWEPVPPRYVGTLMVVQFPPPTPTDGHCGLAGKP